MSLNGWLQISLFFVCVALLAKPMGTYMTLVFWCPANACCTA
jgi:K+-transporting ATPase A subunit